MREIALPRRRTKSSCGAAARANGVGATGAGMVEGDRLGRAAKGMQSGKGPIIRTGLARDARRTGRAREDRAGSRNRVQYGRPVDIFWHWGMRVDSLWSVSRPPGDRRLG